MAMVPHSDWEALRSRRQDDCRSHAGNVTLIYGCMFSGKTTELLRRIAAYPAGTVLAIKHVIDTRYSASDIITHAGKAWPAIPVATASQIRALLRADIAAVAIDEAHFFDASLIDFVRELAGRGLDVLLTSLEPDSWGRPFAINAELLGIANDPVRLFATCARCGAVADRTQRFTPIINGQMVGGPESYESRCRRCWQPPQEVPKDENRGSTGNSPVSS